MRVRVPADIDMADRIFGGFTARQIAILGGAAFGLWAIWFGVGRYVGFVVFMFAALPLAAVVVVWATSPIEGMSAERVAAAAFRFFRSPRRRVLAPEGVVSLGDEGAVLLCRASSLNFSLRSETEQHALVDGFGRLLNSLDTPVQFVVRSEKADLASLIDALEDEAASLPHPALEDAAREHAAYLRGLTARSDVLTRRVLICLRDPHPTGRSSMLDQRAEEMATLLRGLGIKLHRLDEGDLVGTLSRAWEQPSGADVGDLSNETVVGV